MDAALAHQCKPPPTGDPWRGAPCKSSGCRRHRRTHGIDHGPPPFGPHNASAGWPTAVPEAAVCPRDGITSCCRADGFGGQLETLIDVFVFSVVAGRTFCHYPWWKMEHGQKPAAMFEFVGGPNWGPRACADTFAMQHYAHHKVPREWGYGESRRFAQEQLGAAFIRREVRRRYLSTPKPPLSWFTPAGGAEAGGATVQIALHLRQGDILKHSYHAWRRVGSDEALACVRFASAALGGTAASHQRLHVMSEGEEAGVAYFDALRGPRFHVELHLSRPLKETFHHMVEADALIMAPSGLSFAAVPLSRGRVFYPPALLRPGHGIPSFWMGMEPCFEGNGTAIAAKHEVERLGWVPGRLG